MKEMGCLGTVGSGDHWVYLEEAVTTLSAPKKCFHVECGQIS